MLAVLEQVAPVQAGLGWAVLVQVVRISTQVQLVRATRVVSAWDSIQSYSTVFTTQVAFTSQVQAWDLASTRWCVSYYLTRVVI